MPVARPPSRLRHCWSRDAVHGFDGRAKPLLALTEALFVHQATAAPDCAGIASGCLSRSGCRASVTSLNSRFKSFTSHPLPSPSPFPSLLLPSPPPPHLLSSLHLPPPSPPPLFLGGDFRNRPCKCAVRLFTVEPQLSFPVPGSCWKSNQHREQTKNMTRHVILT